MNRIIIAAAGLAGLAFRRLFERQRQCRACRADPGTPRTMFPPAGHAQTAVLAGGCFWGMEGVFEHVKGVKSVTAGYDGGSQGRCDLRPSVSTETTGHAESIRIIYDPQVVSYGTLLRVYFSVAHDPTQLNEQYPDSGPSYRSAIFPAERRAAPGRGGIYRAVAGGTCVQGANSDQAGRRDLLSGGKLSPAFLRSRTRSYPYIVRFDKPKVAALQIGIPEARRVDVAIRRRSGSATGDRSRATIACAAPPTARMISG